MDLSHLTRKTEHLIGRLLAREEMQYLSESGIKQYWGSIERGLKEAILELVEWEGESIDDN